MKEYDLPLKKECEWCYGEGVLNIQRSPVFWFQKPCDACDMKGYKELPLPEIETTTR